MQFSLYVAALMAPLALAAPLRQQASTIVKRSPGTATIHNNCAFDIQVNPCFNGGSDPTETIPAGQSWSQSQMDFGGAGQGVSLKVNQVGGDESNVAQFEYTVNDIMNLVFYDLSFINGSPFQQWEQALLAGKGNPSVACSAGEAPCKQAYFFPDQIATQAAALGTNLDYYVCGTDVSN